MVDTIQNLVMCKTLHCNIVIPIIHIYGFGITPKLWNYGKEPKCTHIIYNIFTLTFGLRYFLTEI